MKSAVLSVLMQRKNITCLTDCSYWQCIAKNKAVIYCKKDITLYWNAGVVKIKAIRQISKISLRYINIDQKRISDR